MFDTTPATFMPPPTTRRLAAANPASWIAPALIGPGMLWI